MRLLSYTVYKLVTGESVNAVRTGYLIPNRGPFAFFVPEPK